MQGAYRLESIVHKANNYSSGNSDNVGGNPVVALLPSAPQLTLPPTLRLQRPQRSQRIKTTLRACNFIPNRDPLVSIVLPSAPISNSGHPPHT